MCGALVRNGYRKAAQMAQLLKKSIFEEMMERLDTEDLDLWAVIARNIWIRRNSVVYGGVFSHPDKVMWEATTSLEDFKSTNMVVMESTKGTVMQQGSLPISWNAPLKGWIVEVNWDAALNKEKGYTSCGIIAHDCEGRVLVARSTTQIISMDPTMAEAWAAL